MTPNARISGWGRNPWTTSPLRDPASAQELSAALAEGYLPRGRGRSYGDAGLPAAGHAAVRSIRLDKFLSFNPLSGLLDAESGASLEAILRMAVPRGRFLPVSPGTQQVSLGGALASNVHGKNHHRCGSIEHFVDEMEVATPAGVFTCSPQVRPDLFRATLGGYGLTGFIVRAKLRLKPVETAQVDCLRLRARDLDALFALFAKHDADYEYSVAWLDTLARGKSMGRGILMLGDHASAQGRDKSQALVPRRGLRLAVPFALPSFALNRPALSAFNACVYGITGLTSCGRPRRESFETFFHPLDFIRDWNRLYGARGFFQYQCAIPDPQGEQGIAEALRFLSDNRLGAFLSVLKRCGDDEVMLPFCKRGYTLALDIPFRGPGTLRLLDRLDAVVLKHGGRVYLTKDARLSAETFRAMYPEFPAWMETVRRYNPEARSDSMLAQRLRLWDP